MSNDRSRAMDHVVLAIFENRSFDNLLGHLYGILTSLRSVAAQFFPRLASAV